MSALPPKADMCSATRRCPCLCETADVSRSPRRRGRAICVGMVSRASVGRASTTNSTRQPGPSAAPQAQRLREDGQHKHLTEISTVRMCQRCWIDSRSVPRPWHTLALCIWLATGGTLPIESIGCVGHRRTEWLRRRPHQVAPDPLLRMRRRSRRWYRRCGSGAEIHGTGGLLTCSIRQALHRPDREAQRCGSPGQQSRSISSALLRTRNWRNRFR